MSMALAYADAYEGGRYVGLTLSAPLDVRSSGLIVNPQVARKQLGDEARLLPAKTALTPTRVADNGGRRWAATPPVPVMSEHPP